MTARGIRLNNPGNIRHSDDEWQGKALIQNDREFVQFDSMEYGIRALVLNLISYYRKHRCTTVREIITRWAPPLENNTEAYIAAVCDGWVRPDEELPDIGNTYLFLAQRIARHENGADAAQITPSQWDGGMALAGFPHLTSPGPEIAPARPESAPPAGDQPSVAIPLPAKEKSMLAAIPWVLTAAQSLFPIVADLFRAHGGKTATRNADILDIVTPIAGPLVEIAKTVTGAQNEQQAAQTIADSPEAQIQFRNAVAADLDRLMGMVARSVEIDDDSRDRAAARATKEGFDSTKMLIERQFWMLGTMSAATVLTLAGAFWLKAPNEVMVGLVVLFTGLVNQTAQKWATIVEYRFGSSAGSQAKDALLAQQIRK